MVVFTAEVANFQSNLWGYHLPVPGELVQDLVADGQRRMRCVLNDRYEMPCALMPAQGDYFILLGKEVRSKLGLRLGQKVKIQLEKDVSKYGVPMPEELEVMLEQDVDGSRFFEALTPGKQRGLIYLVSKVKSTDSRIKKAMAIMHHLKESGGILDSKQLNETIKYYNSL